MIIETQNPEINVDEIMKKIRAEISEIENKSNVNVSEKNGLPVSSLNEKQKYPTDMKLGCLNLQTPFEFQPDGVYQLNSLIRHRGIVFIENAFKALFNRTPESEGLNHYRNLLAQGISRAELIGRLRFSREGRKSGIQVKGLLIPFIMSMLFKVPVVGYFFNVLISVFRLPQIQKQIRQFENQSFDLFYEIRNHINHSFDRIGGHIERLENLIGKAKTELSIRLNAHESDLNRIYSDLKRVYQEVSYLKTGLSMLEHRTGIFLEEARTRLPEPFDRDQLKRIYKEGEHLLDPLYLAFEDQFRGTRRDIKDKLKVYLPVLEQAKTGNAKRPILDIGCGRGEWLELLREKKFTAQGVDLSRVLVKQGIEKGLGIFEADGIEYLQKHTSSSIGAITAFHFIEHLPFEKLIAFLDATLRALVPEGVAIFETPNPQNILVGAQTFYMDPTHRNPLPPQMTKFLVESRGFCRVEIKQLHPYSKEVHVEEDSEVAKRFNDYFYGPQDYAVIGYKV